MNYKEIERSLESKKNGTFFNIVTCKDVSKIKGITILKVTKMTVRKGISYSHTKAYLRNHTCISTTPTSLPWGKWMDNGNIFIEHTNKKGEHNIYLRLYSSPNKPHIKFYMDGKEVSKEFLMDNNLIKPSQKNESGLFTINVDNIVKIL